MRTLSTVHAKRRDAQIVGKRIFTSPRIYLDAQSTNVVVSGSDVDSLCAVSPKSYADTKITDYFKKADQYALLNFVQRANYLLY